MKSKKKGTSLPNCFNIKGKKYEVIKLIAEGGKSYVLKVRHKSKFFALKYCTTMDKEHAEIMKHEAKMLKTFAAYPNIVDLIELSIIKNKEGVYNFLFLMNLCDESLYDIIKNMKIPTQPFNETLMLEIFYQICCGVSVLHYHTPPIFHRDIKVENILRIDSDRYVICDFGSCTTSPLLPSKHSYAEINSEINNYTTPAYRSPEMVNIMMGKTIFTKSDIWALGVLLYTMMFGQLPFSDNIGRIQDALYNIPENHSYSIQIIELLKMLLLKDSDLRPNIFQVLQRVCSLTSKICPYVEEPPELTLDNSKNNSVSLDEIAGDLPICQLKGVRNTDDSLLHGQSVTKIGKYYSPTLRNKINRLENDFDEKKHHRMASDISNNKTQLTYSNIIKDPEENHFYSSFTPQPHVNKQILTNNNGFDSAKQTEYLCSPFKRFSFNPFNVLEIDLNNNSIFYTNQSNSFNQTDQIGISNFNDPFFYINKSNSTNLNQNYNVNSFEGYQPSHNMNFNAKFQAYLPSSPSISNRNYLNTSYPVNNSNKMAFNHINVENKSYIHQNLKNQNTDISNATHELNPCESHNNNLKLNFLNVQTCVNERPKPPSSSDLDRTQISNSIKFNSLKKDENQKFQSQNVDCSDANLKNDDSLSRNIIYSNISQAELSKYGYDGHYFNLTSGKVDNSFVSSNGEKLSTASQNHSNGTELDISFSKGNDQ